MGIFIKLDERNPRLPEELPNFITNFISIFFIIYL